MAFCMTIALPSGVAATYSCVRTTQIYYHERVLDVTLLCFLDEEMCKSGADSMRSWQHRFTFEDIGTDDPSREDIYKACKQLPFWADAKEC